MKRLFLLWGNEDGEEEETTEEVEETTEEETKSITTKELEQMTARAADKATRKAKRELASTLGFDNMAGLTEFITTQKASIDEATDEQTKAVQEAERKSKEFDARMSDIAERELLLSISQAVVGAGVADPKKVQRVSALVRDDLEPDVLDEDDYSGAVGDALQALREDMPELFAKSSTGSGDGGAHGKSTDDDDDAAAKDKQLIESYEKQGLVYHPLP